MPVPEMKSPLAFDGEIVAAKTGWAASQIRTPMPIRLFIMPPYHGGDRRTWAVMAVGGSAGPRISAAWRFVVRAPQIT
jgi:hypothetical protein